MVARRGFPKRVKHNNFEHNPENVDNAPERLARRRAAFELQCFSNCTLSIFLIPGVTQAQKHRVVQVPGVLGVVTTLIECTAKLGAI